MDIKICVVIPAHNEEKTIGEIVRLTKQYIDNVAVINNCSIDNTGKVAKENGALVIDYNDKQGYGATQQLGQQLAICSDYNYILQLDADGQHDPNDIPRFLNIVNTKYFDILVGSRFLGTHKLSVARKYGIMFFSIAVNFIFHSNITDITSGFKVYNVTSLKKLHKPSDINPAIEQMAEIAKKRMKIIEIPIKAKERTEGQSHLSFKKFILYPIRACWYILKVYFCY